MASENSRFRSLPWVSDVQNQTVTVIGAGGIGSWLTLFLSRIGVKDVYLFDADIVDNTNYSGQLFTRDNLFIKKANAVRRTVGKFIMVNNDDTTNVPSPYTCIVPVASKFTGKETTDQAAIEQSDFIIAAVDNMETRSYIYHAFLEKAKEDVDGNFDKVLIDGRLLAEQFSIYTITKRSQMADYERTLFLDSEVPEESCTAKQTSHIAAMIGTYITQLVTNHLCNKANGFDMFDVPFSLEYFGPIIDLKKTNADNF